MVEDVRYKRQLRNYVKQAREESDIQFPAEEIDDAIDLLDLMLTIDPYQRPSAVDLLRHPFFTEHPQMAFHWPSFVVGHEQEMVMKESGHEVTSKVRLHFSIELWRIVCMITINNYVY